MKTLTPGFPRRGRIWPDHIASEDLASEDLASEDFESADLAPDDVASEPLTSLDHPIFADIIQ